MFIIVYRFFLTCILSQFFDRLNNYDHEVAQLGNERKDNLLVHWIATLLTIIIILLFTKVIMSENAKGIVFLVTLSDVFAMCMHMCGTLEKFLFLHLILKRFKHLNEKIAPYVSWDEKRDESKSIKIVKLKILHSMLYDAQQAFSNIYTNPFLWWFASLMIRIVANIHYFREKKVVAVCALISSPIVQLLILCSICHYTAKEVKFILFVNTIVFLS